MSQEIVLSHQQAVTGHIKRRLDQGGDSAVWLAVAVLSYYNPTQPGPSLAGFSTKLDHDAKGAFIQMLQIRDQADWSDDALAELAKHCREWLKVNVQWEKTTLKELCGSPPLSLI
ncbi:hypothetical protein JFQ90_004008 [Aeromonas veronii]|nr:hypothetical protein [Aeromonas veronii]